MDRTAPGLIRDSFSDQKNTGPLTILLLVLVCLVPVGLPAAVGYLLCAVSRNMFFTWCLIAGFLVRLLFVPGRTAFAVMKNALGVSAVSALLLVPSIWTGSPRTMLTVSLKVFLSVGLITLLSRLTPWNKITEALKAFHLPDLLIFLLDTTLQYIAILGNICCDMLMALQLRAVGRNRKKGYAVAGILGVTFLKSRQMADEMYEAMVCRGFEGEYVKRRRQMFTKKDLPLLLTLMAVSVLFVYSQRVI